LLIRCCGNVVCRAVFIFLFHYSGFQPSCHNTICTIRDRGRVVADEQKIVASFLVSS
jgi:hypothetical protein